jgi:hypothetical protein
MARLITLSFAASNTQLLLSTTVGGGGATSSIPLNVPYPFVFVALARTITLTSTDNLSAVNFTITGTNQFGTVITEVLGGPNNNTVTSVNQYHTITNIASSGAYTNFSIGSGSTGHFQWIKVNTFNIDPNITISAEITGTINYTVNQTIDYLEYSKNISSNIGEGSTLSYFINTTPVSFPVTAALTAATTSQIFTLTTPTTGLQGIINSSTGGALILNILQQGII